MLGLKRQTVSRFLRFARQKLSDEHNFSEIKRILDDCITTVPVQKKTVNNGQVFRLPYSIIRKTSLNGLDFNESENIGITRDAYSIKFQVPAEDLVQAVLTDISHDNLNYGKKQASEINYYFDGKNVVNIPRKENVVVEYSSPNIAKPFHAGHLRSTVIGRFIVNISKIFEQNVTSINYLGDWGTQFGYIATAYEKYGSMDAFNENPLEHMLDIYVKINRDGESDPTIHSQAMLFFKNLEQGDEKAIEFWKKCREISIHEYNKMYQRLGISFDITTGESEYSKSSMKIISMLKDCNQLQVNDKTGVQYMDVTEESDKTPELASLLKSDGSTLYLTRDVTAGLDRYSQFSADKLLYVVENGQHKHFTQMARILRRLNPEDKNRILTHVKFGRVEKMSTRKGEVVLLRDILEETRLLMRERMLEKQTTKVHGEELDVVAEKLGVCGIVVQDLKQSRLNNYVFDWNEVLNFNGNTGVFLQYTHARLCSLIQKTDTNSHLSIDYKLLTEDSAIRLVHHLGRYHEVLIQSYMQLEACYMIYYLFTLGRLVNIAHTELQVKNQPIDIANARLALFKCTRQVLVNGLNVVGIEPLSSI